MTEEILFTIPCGLRGRIVVREADDVWPGDLVLVDGHWLRVVETDETPPWYVLVLEDRTRFTVPTSRVEVFVPERP
jgi:hypothetical protein